MRIPTVLPALRFLFLATGFLNLCSCGNFARLGKDLKLVQKEYQISGIIENADAFQCPVKAAVVEWDPVKNQVFSGDRIDLTAGGAFMFIVKSPLHQHVMAYADQNRNNKYDAKEPLWIYRNSNGEATPVNLNPENRSARLTGKLSTSETPPPSMMEAIKRMIAGRDLNQVLSHQGIRYSIGEIASLDDPRFAATRGEDGLWMPAESSIKNGFGIYFLDAYDPAKTPVIFVHGAAGSPQDWRYAMEHLDKRRYQAWFYVYPSGMRLQNAAYALHRGVDNLHQRLEFKRLHVVAHSMGGLVSRAFITRNVIDEGNRYIDTFITFSSPWGGHEAAAMGVKYAPEVVPSWRDMAKGSGFLDHLFDKRLKGKVNHHLFFSHHASRSRILPPENDGTVSVASQKRKEALADAVEVRGFDETHISILSAKEPLMAGKRILDEAR